MREADLPFRLAHEVCASLVRDALDAGRGPESLTAAAVNALASARSGRPVALSEDALRAALDPAASVARRRVPGSPAPEAVRVAIAAAQRTLASDRSTLASRRASVAAASNALDLSCASLARA